MKRKITSLLMAVGSLCTLNAQTQLQEDFTSPFNPATTDWVIINNSAPAAVTSWTQGNQTGGNGTLTAYNGSTNDFYMADFTSISGTVAGGISAWLITPTLSIYNGATLQFATSTFSNSNIYPDRMQVRMAQTNNTVIPTGTTSVGAFTTLMLDINPNLGMGTSSVVNNGTVNGYPQKWTVYSLPVSGVTGTVTGRFAFRYFVDDGGIGGNNSRLVAVDAVSFGTTVSAPTCSATVQSHTICTNTSATLIASGAAPNSTYTWLPGGQATSSIVVTPGSTTTYTLQYTEPNGVCPEKTATVTVGSTLNIQITSTSPSICPGGSATLTASGAAQYGWMPGFVQGATIAVNPTSPTVYTVGGNSGSCNGSATYTVGIYNNPTVTISGNNTFCSNGGSATVTFTGSGASTYTWSAGTASGNGSTFQYTVTAPPAATHTMMVSGSDVNGCMDSDTFTTTAIPNPTVTITGPTGTVCTNSTFTLTANGASSYAWTGGGSSNTLAANSGSTASTKVFTVTGTASGCSSTANFTQTVVACIVTVGIAQSELKVETTIFPNPFSSEIRINALEGSVVVYNALGQVVIKETISNAGTINTTTLPQGAYVVKAFNNSGEVVKTIKLVKN